MSSIVITLFNYNSAEYIIKSILNINYKLYYSLLDERVWFGHINYHNYDSFFVCKVGNLSIYSSSIPLNCLGYLILIRAI
jgi:hypothetical protein